MANDINSVILVGRLTRDAELKYTSSGTAVCKFAIAVNRSRKNGESWEDEAHFFDVVLWGRQGEAIHQYLAKGKQVGVTGELRQNRWQTDDGQNRSRVEIHALNVQLLGGAQGKEAAQSKAAASPETAHKAPSVAAQKDIWDDDFEDDIPI